MLLLDVDGVMTDGGIILSSGEGESKRFDVKDGIGIALARASGLLIGIITGRSSEVVCRRANELNIDLLFQGIQRKQDILGLLLSEHGLMPTSIAYIGDDVPDIPIMERIGMPIAVQDAVERVKNISIYVTDSCGGYGAIREAAEWLLDLRDDTDRAYKIISS